MAFSKLSIYRGASRMLGEIELAATTDNVEIRYVFDDLYDNVVQYCMTFGWWRFAMITAVPTTAAGTVSGYPFKFTKPAGWLRTHSVGVAVGTTRFQQLDWYEQGTEIHCKVSAPILKYIKNDVLTESGWPAPFVAVVEAYLAYKAAERMSQSDAVTARCYKEFNDLMALCRQSESVPPPLNLPEHAVENVTRALLEQGFWLFSLKVAAPTVTTAPASGYTYAFTIPTDHIRTYDMRVLRSSRLYPIDWFEESTKLSVAYGDYWAGTTGGGGLSGLMRLRYVSTDYLAPATWPQTFANAVDMALEFEAARAGQSLAPDKAVAFRMQFDKAVDAQLGKDRLPRPPTLPTGAVDRHIRATLEESLWKFGLKTVEIAAAADVSPTDLLLVPGYSSAFIKPTDWLRTVRVYTMWGGGPGNETDIPFKEEQNVISADVTPIQYRYISNTAIDPQHWTELFYFAIESGLRYEAAVTGGDLAAADNLFLLWQKALGQAKIKDGMNEQPRVRGGRWNGARRGFDTGGYRRNTEQGY